jgi:hypothetical protein
MILTCVCPCSLQEYEHVVAKAGDDLNAYRAKPVIVTETPKFANKMSEAQKELAGNLSRPASAASHASHASRVVAVSNTREAKEKKPQVCARVCVTVHLTYLSSSDIQHYLPLLNLECGLPKVRVQFAIAASGSYFNLMQHPGEGDEQAASSEEKCGRTGADNEARHSQHERRQFRKYSLAYADK